MAATLILEEQRRCREEGRDRRLKVRNYKTYYRLPKLLLTQVDKFGVFFSGWPPVFIKGERVECILADEHEHLIEIPTLHIVGSKDPYIHGAVALFNVCDSETAMLFDHGKGHTLPRDERTVAELSLAVDDALSLVAQCTS